MSKRGIISHLKDNFPRTCHWPNLLLHSNLWIATALLALFNASNTLWWNSASSEAIWRLTKRNGWRKFFFWASCYRCCPLLDRTRSRYRCWAAILLSHRPELSGREVHEEVDGLDIGEQHGRRFVLLRHTHKPQRRPYIPHWYKQERSSAEAVKPDRTQALLWRVIPGVGAGVRDESMEYGGVIRPLRIPLVIRPVRCTILLLPHKLLSCCAAGTIGCLDLRHRTFALDGQVNAEWSRCPGSMARCAGGSVAP